VHQKRLGQPSAQPVCGPTSDPIHSTTLLRSGPIPNASVMAGGSEISISDNSEIESDSEPVVAVGLRTPLPPLPIRHARQPPHRRTTTTPDVITISDSSASDSEAVAKLPSAGLGTSFRHTPNEPKVSNRVSEDANYKNQRTSYPKRTRTGIGNNGSSDDSGEWILDFL